jgi:hypothetical protein
MLWFTQEGKALQLFHHNTSRFGLVLQSWIVAGFDYHSIIKQLRIVTLSIITLIILL